MREIQSGLLLDQSFFSQQRKSTGIFDESPLRPYNTMHSSLIVNSNKLDFKFNYDFWKKCRPRRSTYPACRAVIAARKQKNKFDMEMTLSIQKAYYLHARNPSDYETLIELAEEIGADKNKFSKD